MASFILLLIFIAFFSRISISEAKPSFSFTSSGKNASFVSDDIALYGEAKLFDNGSSIQLNDSVSHGGGRVVYKKPIEFVETESEYPTGFSTFVCFSVSPNLGGKLGFVGFRVNGTVDHSLFEVKFDISENVTKFGDSNVSVIVDGVSEKIRNFTIANLEKKKEKLLLLYAWINYQSSGKTLEVQFSESERYNSSQYLMSSRVDLSETLRNQDAFMVGLKLYSGDLSLHSWSFEARRFPKYMHSYAAIYMSKLREEEEAKRKRREKVWEVVTCFVMTFGSTGLVFFAMMHIWAAFKRNKLMMVMPEECGIKTKEFEYEKMEKMEVVMSKDETKQERK